MAFNPLAEKGRPLEKQVRDWKNLNVTPYDKHAIHPYSRTRVILMNGIETEAALFGHQFARHSPDPDLKQLLAYIRRMEQQHQKRINWLTPADESTLEVTIGYEQVAVDLTAWLAKTEPDATVRAALDFALVEDFDHLYRYANLLDLTQKDVKAEQVVGDLTEIFPGRPTKLEHRSPYDSLRKPYDGASAEFLTKLHVITIVAGEQQTMNFYMNVGNRAESELARGVYLEIAQIEEQHVSQYESLADPSASWFERWVLHEYNECYLYYSCLESETDERLRKLWQDHLEDEIDHLRIAVETMKKHEGRDPAEFLPDALPELTIFESNKEYVRDVVAKQDGLTANGMEIVPVSDLPPEARYFRWQEAVHGQWVPSQAVIDARVQEKGDDYRLETEGEHPVERFRARDRAVE